MPPRYCESCLSAPAACKSGRGKFLCRTCFIAHIEDTVHNYIVFNEIFRTDDIVGVGVSGGKDSTVLLHLLVKLTALYKYPVRYVMLAVDEGISGYRDLSLDCVKESQAEHDLPLKVTSFTDIAGHTLDAIAKATQNKNVCSTCGTLRRHSLSVAAQEMGCTCIATGHNGDDTAETILLNVLRGDPRRLLRCSDSTSECGKIARSAAESTDGFPHPGDEALGSGVGIRRIRPLQCLTQKEIVLYARYLALHYHSTECPYAVGAYRGNARRLLNALEMKDPGVPLRVMEAGIEMARMLDIREEDRQPDACPVCGDPFIGKCQTCELLERLKDNPMLRDVEDGVGVETKRE